MCSKVTEVTYLPFNPKELNLLEMYGIDTGVYIFQEEGGSNDAFFIF